MSIRSISEGGCAPRLLPSAGSSAPLRSATAASAFLVRVLEFPFIEKMGVLVIRVRWLLYGLWIRNGLRLSAVARVWRSGLPAVPQCGTKLFLGQASRLSAVPQAWNSAVVRWHSVSWVRLAVGLGGSVPGPTVLRGWSERLGRTRSETANRPGTGESATRRLGFVGSGCVAFGVEGQLRCGVSAAGLRWGSGRLGGDDRGGYRERRQGGQGHDSDGASHLASRRSGSAPTCDVTAHSRLRKEFRGCWYPAIATCQNGQFALAASWKTE
jgi:hypothetical protein